MHYGPLLARVHHEHFGMVAEAAARELQRRVALAGTVVDLACGGGVLARRMLDAGHRVWGVDISPDMIDIARQHAPAAELRVGSLWDAELPECVAVAAIGEAFCYATDPRAGLDALGDRFASIRDALVDRGVLLFDFACPGRAGPTGETRGYWRREAIAVGVETHERAGELVREIDVYAPEGELWHRVAETHVLRLYDPVAVDALLDRTGFDATHVSAYSDFRFPPGWNGVAAIKR